VHPGDVDFLRLVATVSLLSAVIGLLFLLLLPRDERSRRIRATAIFVGGMAGLAFTFIRKNPNILESAEQYVAITLIGMVIATVSVLKYLKR